MLAAHRRQRILDRLAEQGEVRAAALSEGLGVSLDTVQRDLDSLARSGALVRVRGGALPASPTPRDFHVRAQQNTGAKVAIAEAAVPLLADADVLLLGGGTSVLELARRLPAEWAGTVVTTSPDVAVELCGRASADVVLAGGRVHPETRTVVGPQAVAAVRSVRADVCVLGACSLHAEAGLTVFVWDEAVVEQEMTRRAGRVLALVDAGKLDSAAAFVVAGPAEVDQVVTERTAPEPAVAALRERGVEVVLA